MKTEPLVILSELPPARSEAARAGASLVRLLRRAGYRHLKADWPIPESVDDLLARSDLAVYYLSNDVEDREIHELALANPGLLVLPELALDRLVLGLIEARDPGGTESGKEALALADRVLEVAPDGPLSIPWCAHVVRHSRGVVVHSAFAARYLDALGARTPVFVAPHPSATDPPSSRLTRARAARLRRRLGPAPVVGVVGELSPEMGLDVALEAVGRLPGGGRVAAIGQRLAGQDVEADVASADDRVMVVADPSQAELTVWLQACDVVADLRAPSRGEMSGFLIRALQEGTPVMVGPVGEHLDWLEDAVVRLGPEAPGADAVTHALEGLLGDPGHRTAIVERGRAAAERMAGAALPAYRAAVDATAALVGDPARWTLARWAESLAECGVDEAAVERGYGEGYARALDELARRA
jgi:glycosyltransferase involved in cell wall biosynthesis